MRLSAGSRRGFLHEACPHHACEGLRSSFGSKALVSWVGGSSLHQAGVEPALFFQRE